MSKSQEASKNIDNILPPSGNFISEWLGNRIFPTVRLNIQEFLGKSFGTCPFLSEALRTRTPCVKSENSFGVCTVSTVNAPGTRDWLACPYRVISSNLVRDACQIIFGIKSESVRPVPVTLLQSTDELAKFKQAVARNGFGFVFFQSKLGGEISVISTAKSPEMSFDVTIVEVRKHKNTFKVARYGILEIQTMDFHGSYRAAVQNLRDALRLHGKGFPDALKSNPRWAAEGVEGPNIANVFKRTFYQILLKFQLSGQGAAAGTVLALPRSVWDSWQPFLGAPELELIKDGTYRIKAESSSEHKTNAFIAVFDLDATAETPISPLRIAMHIRVDAEQLSHHAFKVVPSGMLRSLSESDSILVRIKERLATYWPEIG